MSNKLCSNCGLSGHINKQCAEPITSWGILLIKLNLDKFNSINHDNMSKLSINNYTSIEINNMNDLKEFCEYKDMIKFLLVRRKHSLGYSEFMRGRYLKDNINGIIYLFQQMTIEEINMIKNNTFEELWNEFWNVESNEFNKKNIVNKREYLISKEKFEALKNKDGVELPLDFYIRNIKPLYSTPEWGIPKGRKNKGETDISCAIREFCEETGYAHTDIKIIDGVMPIVENIIGTNGVSYRHIYYLAEDISNNIPCVNKTNNNEIGDIGFFTYDNALNILREYHIEKKNIIKNVFMFYMNFFIKKSNDKWISDAEDI